MFDFLFGAAAGGAAVWFAKDTVKAVLLAVYTWVKAKAGL